MNPVRTLVRACRRHSWLRHLARGRDASVAPVPPCLRSVSALRPLSILLAPPDRDVSSRASTPAADLMPRRP